mmetsp:Transcript_86023/g.172231  ORF Transcript_86023/g.172231 Transcript_86023/m.172231 type:complete len:82 (-) Transcript_86023:672-917(-)
MAEARTLLTTDKESSTIKAGAVEVEEGTEVERGEVGEAVGGTCEREPLRRVRAFEDEDEDAEKEGGSNARGAKEEGNVEDD